MTWVLVAAAAGCGGDIEVRTYQEVVESAPRPSPRTPSSPAAAVPPPTWERPRGWVEKPASGMRLAAFQVEDSECTILHFPGSVGGLTANVERWVRQLDRDLPPADAVQAFIAGAPSFRTRGEKEGRLLDFRELLPGTPLSMLVAVFPHADGLLFVKLAGPPDLLEREEERFAQLCRSIQ